MKNQTEDMTKWKEMEEKGLGIYMLKGVFIHAGMFLIIWVLIVPYIQNDFTFEFLQIPGFGGRLLVYGILALLYGLVMSATGWINLKRKLKPRN